MGLGPLAPDVVSTDPHFVAKLASVSSRDELDGFQSARPFTVDELRAIRDRRAVLERAWK